MRSRRRARSRALDEAQGIADRDDDVKTLAYLAWSRAALASLRGDALTTERLLREVERDARDWFQGSTGATFLADAAEMLDRLGLSKEADAYLARARDRARRMSSSARPGQPCSPGQVTRCRRLTRYRSSRGVTGCRSD